MNIKPFFQSSFDPTKVSQTISSAAKVICAVIVGIGATKGLDLTSMTDTVKQLADQWIVIVTTGVASYHSVETLIGLARKMWVEKNG